MSQASTPLQSKPVTPEDIQDCLATLEAIAADSLLLSCLTEEERVRFLMAAGRAIHPSKDEVRRRMRAFRRTKNEKIRNTNKELRETTTIRATRQHSIFIPPPRITPALPDKSARPKLETPDHCYICKSLFTEVHHFYDALCPSCADFNYDKRFQTVPLHDRVALITGARVKIGYQAALTLLRAGAHVIVTTRFPRDAAARYARESDFEAWSSRLDIYGLDLRHSPSVEAFCQFITNSYHRLDFLINNAAQTVRRPPGFYSHLLKEEGTPLAAAPAAQQLVLSRYEQCRHTFSALQIDSEPATGTSWIAEWHSGKFNNALGLVAAPELSQIPYACDDPATIAPELFPEGRLDADLQQVDLRKMNSWRMTLADVPTAELLEVQLINSIAPYILCGKLKPLMLKHPSRDKHVVNVSAMEGKFARHTKTDRHPHTNMAKAALNMMTLTSAKDYAKDGIYMNAVDTGWVTDEDPVEHVTRKQEEQDFHPPLDIVDGAARILDPIISGIKTGNHSWGNFLKDYYPTEW